MSIFDKAKELAQQAAQGMSQAEGLLDNVKGFVPEDKVEQIKDKLHQAQGAVGGIMGQAASAEASDVAKAEASDTEASDSKEQA